MPDSRELVAALLEVEGVAGASIEATGGGPGTLRLQLEAGSDQVTVAGEVNRVLRSKFGLAVDPDRVRVLEQPTSPLPSAPGASPAASQQAGQQTTQQPSQQPSDRPDRLDRPLRGGDGPHPAVGAYARDVIGGLATDTMVATDIQILHEDHGRDTGYGRDTGQGRGREHGQEHGHEHGQEHGHEHGHSGGVAPGRRNGADPAGVSLDRPTRATIDRVQLVSAGLGVTVTVTLGLEGRSCEGEAEGAATQTGVLRSAATATLRAVEQMAEGEARFEVEHVELTRTGSDQTALVVLTMVTGRSLQRLSGASVVREDTRQAVIRAVLAALNRRMEPLLADQ